MPAQMLPQFHPKGHNKINNDRGSKGQEGSINEIQPDTTGGNV